MRGRFLTCRPQYFASSPTCALSMALTSEGLTGGKVSMVMAEAHGLMF